MKKNILISAALLGVSISAFSAAILLNKEATQVSAASLPTSFDLNDTSEANIRSYYSGLDSKSSSQLIGTNLLINLKTILSANNTFLEYGSYKAGVGAAYKITDRNWDASPASSISGYNSSTNKITGYTLTNTDDNPYIINLYTSRDTSVSGNQITNPIQHHTGTSPNFDKEHVFPKSYGFLPSENAGTDMHHLIAADAQVNQKVHSNYPYGYVSSATTTGDDAATITNKVGTPKTSSGTYSPSVSVQSTSTSVVEVADEWKGDVARALLYMVARYNYLSGSGTPTQAEPNLSLVPYPAYTKATFSCADYAASKPAEYGNVKDLIAWHHSDPVDQYELHRNNLIYTNFQNNRNPFIDYPDWVDYIWDSNGNYVTSSTNGYAKPATDTIYDYNSSSSTDSVSLNKSSLSITNGNTATLTATASGSVTWSTSNSSVVTITGSGTNKTTATLTAKGTGTATITAKVGTATATCSVTVTAATVSVTGVTLNKSSTSLTVGGTETLTATVAPSNATNKAVTWSSSNSNVATVSSSGLVTAKAAGTATITVKTSDGSKTATCTVTVSTATVSVTGVSLNKSSTSLEEGDTETLTATISPSNATNQNVTWSSSNTSVATVSSNGLVTAVSAGTATITVKTSDGSKTATCTVTVTAKAVDPVDPADPTEIPAASSDWPYYNDVAYYMSFNNTGTGTNAGYHYFIGSMNGYYGATSTTKTDGVSMYFESDSSGHYLYFLSSGTKNYIYVVKSGNYTNFTYSTSNKSVFTYDSSISAIVTDVSGTSYGLGTSSNYYTFGAQKSTTSGSYYSEFELVNSNTAFSFGANLLNNLTCDNGKTAPSKTTWSSLSTEYSALETGWKNLLASATANESGNNVEKAVARYDYIVSKYGTSNYSNFIGRTIQSAPRALLANIDSDNSIQIILVVISITSLLGAGLFIKKSKEQ